MLIPISDKNMRWSKIIKLSEKTYKIKQDKINHEKIKKIKLN